MAICKEEFKLAIAIADGKIYEVKSIVETFYQIIMEEHFDCAVT